MFKPTLPSPARICAGNMHARCDIVRICIYIYIYIYIYIRAREAEKVSRAARRHSSAPSTVSGILRGDQSACTSRLLRGNRLRGASPGHKTRFTIETVADAASSRCTRVSRAIASQFPLIRRNGSGEDAFFYSKSEKRAPISNSAVPRIPIAPSQIAASSPQDRKTGNALPTRRERRFATLSSTRANILPPSICTTRFRGDRTRAACLPVYRARDKLRDVIESRAVSRGDLKIPSARGGGIQPDTASRLPATPRIRIASRYRRADRNPISVIARTLATYSQIVPRYC